MAKIHLRYCYRTAYVEYKINKHAQSQMSDLGIKYSHSTPQSMGEQFWFWNCENVPDELPKYLQVLNTNPLEAVGFGLSETEAREILAHQE